MSDLSRIRIEHTQRAWWVVDDTHVLAGPFSIEAEAEAELALWHKAEADEKMQSEGRGGVMWIAVLRDFTDICGYVGPFESEEEAQAWCDLHPKITRASGGSSEWCPQELESPQWTARADEKEAGGE